MVFQKLLAKLIRKEEGDVGWDDVSNEDLDPQKVKDARNVEMDFFHNHARV